MGALGFLLAIVLCGMIVKLSEWRENKKEERERQSIVLMNQDAVARQIMKETFEKSKNDMEEQKGTRDLFLEALIKIGCQYTVDDEDDGRYYFAYQGENFAVDMSNDRMYVQLWDMFWASVELYDIDKLAQLKKVINESNLRYATTTIYTVNEAGSTVDVHCKSVILFCAQIPDLETYLRAELNDFFHVHQYINAEMAKLKEQEEARV